MKKSDFIEKVLKHKLNTIFVNPEQVDRVIEMFEDLGILPPSRSWDGSKRQLAFINSRFLDHQWEPEDEN